MPTKKAEAAETAAPAAEATDAVGTAVPHCVLLVATTADGKTNAVTVVELDVTVQPKAVTKAEYESVTVGLIV